MHHRPLVEQTSHQVNRQRDQGDDQEQSARTHTAGFMCLGLGAGVLGLDAEDVGAFVLIHFDKG
jgi:hypothetical protein